MQHSESNQRSSLLFYACKYFCAAPKQFSKHPHLQVFCQDLMPMPTGGQPTLKLDGGNMLL